MPAEKPAKAVKGTAGLPARPQEEAAPPPRTPWRPGFPDVVIHATLAVRNAHPRYAAAKAGDAEAALVLAQDLLNRDAVTCLKELVGAGGAILLPVTALEVAGFNAIPDAMAQLLAEELDWGVGAGTIVQNNKVGHTRAHAFNRLVTPAAFEGQSHRESTTYWSMTTLALGARSPISRAISKPMAGE
jgi:hypothetical protein